MNFNDYKTAAADEVPFERLFAELRAEDQNGFAGCSGAIGPLCLAGIAREARISMLVTPTVERAKELAAQVEVWLGNSRHRLVCMLPERDSVYDQTAADPNVLSERIAAMSLQLKSGGLVIMPAVVMLERFYSPEKWLAGCFEVKRGHELARNQLINKLVTAGYERVSLVEERGTFAVRGSLLDVFTPVLEHPVRLDFFGDDLESIKYFSEQTQRSFDKVDRFLLVPVSEYLASEKDPEHIVAAIREEMATLDARRSALLERKLERFISHAGSRDYKELKPFVERGAGHIWQFWQNPRILLDEGDQVFSALIENSGALELKYEQLEELTPLRRPVHYYHSAQVVSEALHEMGFELFSRFGKSDSLALSETEMHPLPTDSSRETLLVELRQLLKSNWAVGIIINDENRLQNLRGLLGERKLKIHTSFRPMGLKYGSILFVQGPSRRGFKDYRHQIAIFAEEDIYPGPARDASSRRSVSRKNLLDLSQMVPGDMVVHADHGVAEFRGVQMLTAGGNTREYLLLQYAGTDKLYVPTDQVHKVSKYIGMEGFTPSVHSLNSKLWTRQKKRVHKNVETIARDLVELYAKRIASSGFASARDCELQAKMEQNFEFVETPDQLEAIKATKADMESSTPMDRLICGDVGYGKTEVAMRAAFKAVCSGKQVAILAPTTLLALQHYQTVVKRFAGFPVTVDMVSRLRPAAVQKVTIKKAKSGNLDILIGTHRLLSADIAFSDLGLLIVDEEQRFGVKHKEKLKKLKSQIDVLTLTATPIPRTMQMAMSGIRQISIIDTPPRDRLAVQTYVAPMDSAWVKRAIIEELKRGGQVFYVYNRVEKIDQKAALLKALVPDARIQVAHGQMPERNVEKTMLDFVNRKFDVLMATTIIESGLDIPNANTLIVDEAERLGLSQMYQLRGRVGRSARQAWAYFFYSRHKRLTKDALERLETIEEHTALGSGFKIALRDLQIRGAGNILGETQSGHIASIGFTLYMELLEEAVARFKRGPDAPEKFEASIEIPVTAYLPTLYVPEEETRVGLYARLSRCGEIDHLEAIREECEDRFGKMPPEGETLFLVSYLRILAMKAGVRKITRVLAHLRFEFVPGRLPDISQLFAAKDSIIKDVYLDPRDNVAIQLKVPDGPPTLVIARAQRLLDLLTPKKVEEANERQN